MLITCPDCGREMSSQAKSCPYCGRPNRIFMDANSRFLKKQALKSSYESKAEEAKNQLSLGVTLFLITAVITFLLMKAGFAPTTVESNSFLDFVTNPQAWMTFYLSFFVIFYLALSVMFFGRLLNGIIMFILLFFGIAYLTSLLPWILQGVVVVGLFCFPLFYLILRPVYMLIKAGACKAKARSIVDSEEDRFIRQVREMEAD